jgi:hypothetical protein
MMTSSVLESGYRSTVLGQASLTSSINTSGSIEQEQNFTVRLLVNQLGR